MSELGIIDLKPISQNSDDGRLTLQSEPVPCDGITYLLSVAPGSEVLGSRQLIDVRSGNTTLALHATENIVVWGNNWAYALPPTTVLVGNRITVTLSRGNLPFRTFDLRFTYLRRSEQPSAFHLVTLMKKLESDRENDAALRRELWTLLATEAAVVRSADLLELLQRDAKRRC